ncbi:hypothetical protein [Sorangium sp. So ce887]|uniref:hypothetical protein n=1 Tax=Sorangium sp. So ce887 TaxID=3133324 RepID=UPI003F5F34AC
MKDSHSREGEGSRASDKRAARCPWERYARQQKVDGAAGSISPTGSPPLGAQAPGSTATISADLLPRPSRAA